MPQVTQLGVTKPTETRRILFDNGGEEMHPMRGLGQVLLLWSLSPLRLP